MKKGARRREKATPDDEYASAMKRLERPQAEVDRLAFGLTSPARATPSRPHAIDLAISVQGSRTSPPLPLPGSALRLAIAVMALRRGEELEHEARDRLIIAHAQRDAGAIGRAAAEYRLREETARVARIALQRVRDEIQEERNRAARFGGPIATARADRLFAKLFDQPPPQRGSRPAIESRSMTREEYETEHRRQREEIRQVRIAARLEREKWGGK